LLSSPVLITIITSTITITRTVLFLNNPKGPPITIRLRALLLLYPPKIILIIKNRRKTCCQSRIAATSLTSPTATQSTLCRSPHKRSSLSS
jgi:hypothetical protein